VALAWAPDGRLFVAERSGTIAIANGTEVSTFTTVPTTTTQPGGGSSERGLLGLALSPTFSADRLVYAWYSSANRTSSIVERWTECRGQALNPTTIVRLPAGADCCHKGGRLAFGPDGKLYVTIGDEHSVPAPPAGPNPPVPQQTNDPRGKVLRYDPDGSIPADNPFGPKSPVWVAGLRNPFGIAFGPDGQVLVTSNGPTGDAGSPGTGYDLALLVHGGDIGQWPYCYGYSHPISPYTSCHGRSEPVWSSESATFVPTGATWVDRDGPAPYADHFVFCNDDVGMRVFRTGSPHASVQTGPAACKLDVKQGPDHALYYTDDATIYRLG
jgi:glucose/arabinose dehydrogenase